MLLLLKTDEIVQVSTYKQILLNIVLTQTIKCFFFQGYCHIADVFADWMWAT